jgi:cell surface protein SprA
VRDGAAPNGRFDLEDPTYQNRPELLTQFDRGLNGRDVADKFYVIPNETWTGWDTLSRRHDTLPGGATAGFLVFPRGPDNPSGDLFRRYDRDNLSNYRFANGTWGNSIYDNENIDGDGVPRINITESYVSFSIDLDAENSPYIDHTARLQDANGWRLYRIPIKDILDQLTVVKDTSEGGEPDWSRVRGLRLVWYDFDERMATAENELLIAGLELVGNYWEPAPGMADKVEPLSISNFEDITYYNSVFGTIVRPRAGEVTPEERSLRLRFFNMAAGDTALVRRSLSMYPQNISGYDSVSVMVFSHQPYGDDLKFVLRFGSDDSTYYEYAAPLMASMGWNTLTFSLQDLSDLKLLGEADIDNRPMDVERGQLRVVAPAGKRPNFTAITYMAVGVVRGAGGPIEGEVWVNELIASGARRLTGVAARVNVATQWADFLSLSAGASYTDGDFRTMTDNALLNDNRSELSANVSARIRADRFLPDRWGVSIPVGGSVSGALSRPTVKPQSDILLLNDDGRPDGFTNMAGDAFNMLLGRETQGEQTRAQRFETFTTTRTAYTAFEKTSESENPLVGFTLDRIKTDVSYNMTASVTGRGPHTDPDSADFLRTDTVVTYAGNLRYDLSPRNPPQWTSASPFSDMEWLPAIHRRYTFNMLPSTINFDVAEIQHRTETRNDPRLNVHSFTTRTFDMRHGMRVEYTPIAPLLALSYGTRLERDLSDVLTRNDWGITVDSTLPRIFGLNQTEGERWDEYGLLYGERGRTQNASARLTPQFVAWMTHTAEYSANYAAQAARRDNDSAQYINASVGTSLRFRNTLQLNDLMRIFVKTPAGAGQGGRERQEAGSRGRRGGPSEPVEIVSEEPADTAAAPAAPRVGFMEWLAGGITKINMRTVSFEYDVNTDLRNSFLSSTYLADTLGMSSFDFFRYQLGMRRTFRDYMFGTLGEDGLGWMGYRVATGVPHDLYRFDQSRGSWAARLSTSFTIPDPFRINFTSVSYGWGREFQAQPDTTFIDTTVVLPELRASANTEILGNLSFVKRHLTRLGATSAASYKRTRKETRDRTDTTSTFEFQPLLSLDGRFQRWPTLSANYRYGRSNSRTVTGGKGEEESGTISTRRSARNSHTATAAYELTGGIGGLQEIRIRQWVLPVQGRTTMGLGVNWETTVTRVHKIGDEDEERERESTFNYLPFLEYRFTDNIRGRAEYLGSHKNSDGRRTTNQRFGLTAEVVF